MGWWRKLLAWLGLGGRRTKRLPPLKPQRKKIGPPPETLVARLERATARNHDDQIVRLAFESVRRGHPAQAEIAYERAAQIYRAHGLHRKAIAVLWALVRLRPEDPAVYELLGEAYEGAERSADAARAYGSAARGWERDGEAERARQLSERARALLERPARSKQPLQVDPPPAKDPIDRPGSMPALSEPAPSASEDLSDEEVRSLVLEGLDLEPRVPDPAAVPVARVQTAQRLADPAEPAALDLDSPEPFVLEGLDAPDPEAPPKPGASPPGAGSMVWDDPVDPEPEPAADPTLAVQSPAANPASRAPGPGRIPQASTVYDPDGSAALKAARARATQSRQSEAATSVATDEQVRALLERLRKGRDPSE
ncbi:MAG TPA: hypothetical protein RMG48_13580 [Myxococcales bacterium LLY-WYZ-16_1]|nr:hypothetical protein [Myxococcales bacterium LLY-WYZ-16_1]